MRRWWAATAVGALTALGPIAPALGGSARPVHANPARPVRTNPARPVRFQKSVTAHVVGSLSIAWQGDQARGCAPHGLCGVTGSLQVLPSGGFASSPGPPPIELNDPNAVARVIEASTTGAASAQTTCADPVPVNIQLRIRRSGNGGLRAVVAGAPFLQELPSAGRCAGPTAADLSALTLPARRVGRYGYDLSGQTTFGAGSLTVTATSTLRVLISRGGNSVGGGVIGGGFFSHPVAPPRIRTRLQAHAELDYRIEGLNGTLTTTFTPLGSPVCDSLGACGTTGRLAETFSSHGTLSFFGSRFVKRRVARGAAIAMLRTGRLDLYASVGAVPIRATTTESLARPDGTTCLDNATAPVMPGQSEGVRHRAIALGLIAGGENAPFVASGGDGFRTRCPGPSGTDILGGSQLATADIPLRELGARRLTVTCSSDGHFIGTAYEGEHGGSVVLRLVLTHARGGTIRVPTFAPPAIRLP